MARHVSDFTKSPIDIVIDLVNADNGISLETEKVRLNAPKQAGARTSVKIDGVPFYMSTSIAQSAKYAPVGFVMGADSMNGVNPNLATGGDWVAMQGTTQEVLFPDWPDLIGGWIHYGE